MTVEDINSMVRPVMDLPALRVEREDHGEWFWAPVPTGVDSAWVNEETSAMVVPTRRVAVYGLWAMTETVIATGRRTKVYTYRLHHFEEHRA